MSDTLALGLVQMASTAHWDDNRQVVEARLAEAGGRCDLVVFPENVFCLGCGQTVLASARPICDLYAELGGLCRTARQAAAFGGVPVAEGGKAMNSSLVFDADGALLARYDKMHLFQFNLGRPGAIDETATYGYGPYPVDFEFHGWRIGLTICYDIRFPEFCRAYAGVDVILCTAAFTRQTGQAHWDVLLRARAIENLCYVAGVGQCGANPETGTALHGHTMAVEPWGEVLACLDRSEPALLEVHAKRARIEAVRASLPALDHRRLQVVQEPTPG